MQESKQQTGFRATLKSSDTEETIDIYFYRPLGYAWALLFRKLGVSPNVVTVLSIFLGIGAGISFYFPTMGATLLGILLLVWANSYDSADGQLARMTQNFSPLGRILDGFAGNLWFITIYFAICFRLFSSVGILDLGIGNSYGILPFQTGGDGRLLPKYSSVLFER